MSEGDAIHRLARRLSRQLRGATVERAIGRTSKVDATVLNGLTLDDIQPLGKHLLMRFTEPATKEPTARFTDAATNSATAGFTLHSHLKVQGRWTILGAGRRLPAKLRDQARIEITFADGRTAVALDMPVLDLVRTELEHTIVGHVGPDVLADDFDVDTAAVRLQRDGKRPAVEALLDQRNVSGLGNVWVIEVLFLRGVHPDRPVDDIDAPALLRLAQKMMRYSRDRRPGMITTGNKRKGKTHWVYGRAGQSCDRCHTPIVCRPKTGLPYQRETWWCPHCQPLHSPDVDMNR